MKGGEGEDEKIGNGIERIERIERSNGVVNLGGLSGS